MRYTLDVRPRSLASLVLAFMVGYAGCSSGERPPISDRPVDHPSAQVLPEPVTGAPPEVRATEASPQNSRPSPEYQAAPPAERTVVDGAITRPSPPAWPTYVSLLAKLEDGEPASMTVTAETQRSLSLTTRNVSRFRIQRDGSPLSYGTNVILRIDGQGLEWTGRYEALVLERSRNGVWEVAERVDRRP